MSEADKPPPVPTPAEKWASAMSIVEAGGKLWEPQDNLLIVGGPCSGRVVYAPGGRYLECMATVPTNPPMQPCTFQETMAYVVRHERALYCLPDGQTLEILVPVGQTHNQTFVTLLKAVRERGELLAALRGLAAMPRWAREEIKR